MTVLDYLTLTPQATAVRQRLTAEQVGHLVDAVEQFALISNRPVIEITDRLLCGYDDVLSGRGIDRLVDLIVDVWNDDDTNTAN